jgi:ABC-type enterobactin transport system permease subunit
VSSDPGIDVGRFGRTLVLIGFVTTVFLFLITNRLSGDTLRIGVVAVGTMALITAITGFLIAAGSAVDAS